MSESARTTSQIYAGFMEEIKWRVAEMGRRLPPGGRDLSHQDAIFDVEFCYLQLRFVCELIALSSLVAHHSHGLGNDLLKKWHADQIFAELEEINEHCFPFPVQLVEDAAGNKQFIDRPEAEMTRSELKDIYGKCGNALHRGVLKHALAGKDRSYNVTELMDWISRISALLVQHSILFPMEERGVLVGMFGGENHEVVVLEIEAAGPFCVNR